MKHVTDGLSLIFFFISKHHILFSLKRVTYIHICYYPFNWYVKDYRIIIGTGTYTQKDAGSDNIQRPRLAFGKRNQKSSRKLACTIALFGP